jgi:hypothetical protein
MPPTCAIREERREPSPIFAPKGIQQHLAFSRLLKEHFDMTAHEYRAAFQQAA